LSPLLFGIVMDCILKASMKDRVGIEWIDGEKLSDLNFADAIALLENSWEGIRGLQDVFFPTGSE